MIDNQKAVEAGMRFINSESLPEGMVARLEPFNNKDFCGLVIKWAKRGVGFGEITISCHKETKKWSADTETMGPEFCGEAFMALKPEVK